MSLPGPATLLLLTLGVVGAGCDRAEAPFAHDPARGVPDAEARVLLETLLDGSGAELSAALDRIVAAGDRRFVAPLIELLRVEAIPALRVPGYNRRIVALERLAQQRFGGDGFAWSEWYAATALRPPPGFQAFKGRLLGRLDPGYPGLLSEGRPAALRVEEIQWGGVGPDGIPPLDAPRVVPAAEAVYLRPQEPVVGLVHQGAARAYPLRILDWHEVVNDRLGGEAVTVTTCPLSGVAAAFRGGTRSAGFATSGLLYRSNKLLLDRETRSLWHQLNGAPALGPRVRDGEPLRPLPVVVTRWADWLRRHPNSDVLSLETGFERPYEPGAPYAAYHRSPDPLYPATPGGDELPRKAWVYGLGEGAMARAWPVAELTAARVVNDRVAGQPVVLVAPHGVLRVEAVDAEQEPVAYLAGAAVRAYRRPPDRRFAPGPDPDRLLDDLGRSWRVTEAALLGPDSQARRLPGLLSYWFVWQAFHPDTRLARSDP